MTDETPRGYVSISLALGPNALSTSRIPVSGDTVYLGMTGHGNGDGDYKYLEIKSEGAPVSDAIRVWYDLGRDGWVIEQPVPFAGDPDDLTPSPEWREAAFVQV